MRIDKNETNAYSKRYYQDHREEIIENCKEYDRENRAAIREDRREYHRVYQSQWHARLKQIVLNHYGTTCRACGEANFKKLCVDHIEENGKSHREELGLKREGFNSQFYSWLIKNNFPDGYQTLCQPCNLRKSYLHRNGLDGELKDMLSSRSELG